MTPVLELALAACGALTLGLAWRWSGRAARNAQVTSAPRPPAGETTGQAPAPAGPPGQAAAVHAVEPGLQGPLLAVLAAAATEALGRPVRMHRVHLHGEPDREAWSRAGRLDILLSHRGVGQGR